MTLSIHLLGRPRIELDRNQVAGPRGRKAWSLLAFLLLTGAPVGRERLATLLFADADDPLGALRWNLAELRRLLGPTATLEGDPVSLRLPADAVIDVATLASGTWVEAVQVPSIGHDLLEGADIQASAAFEAWLLAERRRVANLSAAVLREAATARLAAGDADGAIELATKLVAADEYDEDAHALLVRAHLAAGHGPEARRYLAETIERFRRELGVEPSAALRDAASESPAATRSATGVARGAAAIDSLIGAGEAALGAGVFDAGIEILGRSVTDARGAGERQLEARALVALGTAFVHGGRGRDAEGATALHAALAVGEALDAPAIVAEASRELGYSEMKRARYARADWWLERAVAVAPDRNSRAAAIAIHGAVICDVGHTARSIELLSEAADDADRLDKPRLEAWSRAFLGRSHLLRGELELARAALSRAVEITRAAGWLAFLAMPQSLLAGVDLAQGRPEEAATGFEASFALGCQLGDPCWEGIAARGIGLVHAHHARIEEAVRWLDDARTRCMRISDAYMWVHAYCLDALCGVAVEHGVSGASAWVSDLETVAARTGMNEMLVRAHLHRARLGNRESVETASLFAERIDNPAILAEVSVSRPPDPVGDAVPA